MFKPPKGIKYGIVTREALEEAMDGDARLSDIAKRRMESQLRVDALRAIHKEKKAEHKTSFWALWRAECVLAKERLKHTELATKLKAAWQKRCWELFRILRIRKVRGKKKTN